MKVNEISCGKIYNATSYTPKSQVNVSRQPSFEGKADTFIKSEPIKGIKGKIKKLSNLTSSKQNSSLPLAEKVDGSDFSKLEGELIENGCKVIKNSEGKVVRQFISYDNKRLDWFMDFDPKTGNPVKETYLQKDGKTLDWFADYDPQTRHRVKETCFQEDGKTLDYIYEYNPENEHRIRGIQYQADGKTIQIVHEHDPITGRKTRDIYYQEDGKTLDRIDEYDSTTGNIVKSSIYQADGKTLDSVKEYHPLSGRPAQKTDYQKDGKTLKKVVEYNPFVKDDVIIQTTYYTDRGKVDRVELGDTWKDN